MNHLLSGLERDGYIRREPSPHDRRGAVIRLTGRGRDVERIAHDSAARLEREWAALLDPGTIERLRELLVDVDTAVGAAP